MEEKKQIKISLGTTICIFIIIILIMALVLMYYYYNNIQNNNLNNNNIINEQNKNIIKKDNNLIYLNKEETTKQQNYLEDYQKYVENFSSSDMEIKSTTVDIDNDGIYELMIKSGTCEADMKMNFYTYKSGKIINLGSTGCGNSVFYKMNNENYLLEVFGHMGYEQIYEVKINNNKIEKNIISSREISQDEEYKEGDILLEDIL